VIGKLTYLFATLLHLNNNLVGGSEIVFLPLYLLFEGFYLILFVLHLKVELCRVISILIRNECELTSSFNHGQLGLGGLSVHDLLLVILFGLLSKASLVLPLICLHLFP
jgi:hypothetical protein